MQTFLPYPSFQESAKCLDRQRLGKQRVECKQIYQCLTGQGSLRWRNHPAVKMWEGYTVALLYYAIEICIEWQHRGYKDTLLDYFEEEEYMVRNKDKTLSHNIMTPTWFCREDFHAAHRSNLLRKNKEYYSQFGWTEPDNLPYIWS